jgi:ABC-2 type transport system ATP-binding protein
MAHARLAISATGLTKSFYPQAGLRQTLKRTLTRSTEGRVSAVERVSFDVRQGELFGLLGPNGAGKTTLVKLLCTLLLPDAGTATVNGYTLSDEAHVKASIGLAAGQERSFYPRLSGRDNLAFFAALHGFSPAQTRARIAALTELLGMGDFIDRRFDGYSAGMKQRLDIARALLHEPPILFLDEPTKSLDPTAAARLRETIGNLVQREGHTVVLVTHQLHEAESLCDRVAIMQQGRIRAIDTIAELRRRIQPERRYRLTVAGLSPTVLSQLEGVAEVADAPASAQLSSTARVPTATVAVVAAGALSRVIEAVVRSSGAVLDVAEEILPLEEVYQQVLDQAETGDADPA